MKTKKILVCAIALAAFLLLLSGCSGKDRSMPTETPQSAAPSASLPLSGKKICIDAGHGINSDTKKEPVAPGSQETKRAFVSGTRGKNQTEEQLNLKVAQKLEKKLSALGADVYMTRTTGETEMSNIDRAKFANEKNADIAVKIHADGSENPAVHGISVLVPGKEHIADSALAEQSRAAGELVLEKLIDATDAANRGISVRNDMTGFNWSEIPVILVETGFMTNAGEDAKLEDESYQNLLADGIANGLVSYFN